MRAHHRASTRPQLDIAMSQHLQEFFKESVFTRSFICFGGFADSYNLASMR